MNDLYQAIAEEIGYSEPPVYAAPRPGEVHATALHSTKTESRMGGRLEMDLATGLEQAVKYSRNW